MIVLKFVLPAFKMYRDIQSVAGPGSTTFTVSQKNFPKDCFPSVTGQSSHTFRKSQNILNVRETCSATLVCHRKNYKTKMIVLKFVS